MEVQSTPDRKLVGGAPLDYWGSAQEEWEEGSQAWAPTLMHQIHCLGMMKSSWQKIEEGEFLNVRRQGHFPHCIEYLRQAVMCQADLTLGKCGGLKPTSFETSLADMLYSHRACNGSNALADRNEWLGCHASLQGLGYRSKFRQTACDTSRQ